MFLGFLRFVDRALLRALWAGGALGQVLEGDTEVVNIRETDGRLGPLIFALVALGVVTIFATVAFWWLTRPPSLKE